jgi:tmRNA-binding protein
VQKKVSISSICLGYQKSAEEKTFLLSLLPLSHFFKRNAIHLSLGVASNTKKIYKAIKKSQKDCKEVEEWKGTKDSGN